MSNPAERTEPSAGLNAESLPKDTPSLALTADEHKVREFLIAIGSPWHICPATHWAGWTFRDLDEAVAAVLRANQEGCVYFLANTPKRGRLSGRSRKKWDVARVNAVFLDIDDPDPEIARELQERLDWPPTYVAFTGGGWQAMWRLSEPTTPTDGEAIAVWLQSEFEDLTPDSTHSCEHIFRLPGTRNRKADRNDRMCEVVASRWESALPLSEVDRLEPGPCRRPASLKLTAREDVRLDQLWEVLPPWALRLLDDPTDVEGAPFASRSEHEWAFVGACVRDGVPAELIRDLLLLPAEMGETNRVSHRAHWAKVKGRYVPRRNPEAHALRQIGSFLAKGGSDE